MITTSKGLSGRLRLSVRLLIPLGCYEEGRGSMNISTQIRMMKRFVPILWSLVAVLGVLDPLVAQQFPPPPPPLAIPTR